MLVVLSAAPLVRNYPSNLAFKLVYISICIYLTLNLFPPFPSRKLVGYHKRLCQLIMLVCLSKQDYVASTNLSIDILFICLYHYYQFFFLKQPIITKMILKDYLNQFSSA